MKILILNKNHSKISQKVLQDLFHHSLLILKILLVSLILLKAINSFNDSSSQYLYLLSKCLLSFSMSKIIKLHRKTLNNKALWEWTSSLSNQLPLISYLLLTGRTLKSLNLIHMLLPFRTKMVKQKTIQTFLKMQFHTKLMPYKLRLISFTRFKQGKQLKLSLRIAFW